MATSEPGTAHDGATGEPNRSSWRTRVARLLLAAFLVTFLCARILVLLIMTRRIPDLYLYAGQTHVHHLNYGIFLLSGVGAYLVFFPRPRPPNLAVLLYGVGLALTFDEFGMWLHLGGGYWQRASFDAVTIIASGLALVAVAPAIKRFRPRHWATAALSVVLLAAFVKLAVDAYRYTGARFGPRLHDIEQAAPQ
jgi:hypothetical protein